MWKQALGVGISLLFISNAHAETFAGLGTDFSDTIALSTVKRVGSVVDFSLITIMPPWTQIGQTRVDYIVSQQHIDCEKKTIKIISAERYRLGKEDPIDVLPLPELEEAIAPGTTADMEWRQVCRRIDSRGGPVRERSISEMVRYYRSWFR